MTIDDQRQYAPATQRNREPITRVLTQVLPMEGSILELASGSGEHALYFAPQFAPRLWIPSDPNPLCRDSIRAWQSHSSIPNLAPPCAIDVTESLWSVEETPPEMAITAMVAINLIHISPWKACEGLLAGANRILPSGGVLYLYGPYRQQGVETAPCNEAFDHSLKTRNPDWGLRSLEAVTETAQRFGLKREQVITMPANNLSVVFHKES